MARQKAQSVKEALAPEALKWEDVLEDAD